MKAPQYRPREYRFYWDTERYWEDVHTGVWFLMGLLLVPFALLGGVLLKRMPR